MKVILASSSPRRADLLRAAGIAFEVRPAHVDETVHPGEDAERYAARVAEAKVRAVAPGAGCPVLGADTVVVVDGGILGKPRDREDAARMLRLLSGRRHQVLTAVALAWPAESAPGVAIETGVECTDVEFRAVSEDEVAQYVASGEPMDKAGAYAIQGLGGGFIPWIKGSYSNVVGLPMNLVVRMLRLRGPV